MQVSSAAFADHGDIPSRFTCQGANQSRSVTALVQAVPGLSDGTIITNSAYSISNAQGV